MDGGADEAGCAASPTGSLPSGVAEEWHEANARFMEAVRQHRVTQERILARLAGARSGASAETAPATTAAETAAIDGGDSRNRTGEAMYPHAHGHTSSVPTTVNVAKPKLSIKTDVEDRAGHESFGFPSPVGASSNMGQMQFPMSPTATVSDPRLSSGKSVHFSEMDLNLERIHDGLHFDRQSSHFGFRAYVGEHLVRIVDWWLCLNEPPRKSCLAKFLRGDIWGALTMAVIALNTVFMVYAVNKSVSGALTASDEPSSSWEEAVGPLFTMFFTIELLLKLQVHRQWYFCNEDYRWNIFDMGLVILSFIDLAAGDERGGTTFLRAVRVLRVARALRILRLLGNLRRMLQSICGTLQHLASSIFVMTFIIFIFSLTTVMGLGVGYDPDKDEMGDSEVKILTEAFGSVRAAMLTFHSATSGGNDWRVYYDVLVQTGWFPAALFLAGIAFIQISLMNILTGIFVEEALKVAEPDRDTIVLERRREEAKIAEQLKTVLQEIDTDRSGTITWDEFKTVAEDPKVYTLLQVLGLDIRDAHLFFEMVNLSSQTQEVNILFLADALLGIRGEASGFDVHTLRYQLHLMSEHVLSIEQALQAAASRAQKQGHSNMIMEWRKDAPAADGAADAEGATWQHFGEETLPI